MTSYDFFEIRNGTQRVEKSFVDQGYLQSRVRLERGIEADQARMTLTVTTGPKVDLQFMGITPPGRSSKRSRPSGIAACSTNSVRTPERIACASG